MEKKLRKNQNNLTILGIGVILFGLWTVVKILLQYTLDRAQVREMVNSIKTGMNGKNGFQVTDGFIIFFILILTLLFLLVIVCLRLYIGISAINEGLGRKKGKGVLYLIVAAIMAISNGISVYGIIMSFTEFSGNFNTVFDKASALVIDASSLIILIEMINASIKVKLLTSKLRK